VALQNEVWRRRSNPDVTVKVVRTSRSIARGSSQSRVSWKEAGEHVPGARRSGECSLDSFVRQYQKEGSWLAW
jgi:hypothetical protein